MSKRPTPETDAFLAEYYPKSEPERYSEQVLGVSWEWPKAQFIRRLERERDEAREQLDIVSQRLTRTEMSMTRELSKLADQLDEAREALSRHQVVTKTLPCPFCGSAPTIAHRENTDGVDIRCLNPDCILHYGLDLWMGEPEMVQMWNRRTANAHALPDDRSEYRQQRVVVTLNLRDGDA